VTRITLLVDGKTIPDELCEAARIDGLTAYGIWAPVVLPLSKPALASLALLTFVNTWNDYVRPFNHLTSSGRGRSSWDCTRGDGPAASGPDRTILKASMYLAVQRWYLSLAALVLLGIIVAAFLVQPVIGVALAPAPLLFVAWSKPRSRSRRPCRRPDRDGRTGREQGRSRPLRVGRARL
jgi:ABC-type sugar transport system permease subunit